MKENLYSFSKKAWHVKLFKWIWNIDPTKKFKSMCPYFWSFIATIILLPILLISKLFGKYGSKFRDYLYNYNIKKRNERIKKLNQEWFKILEPSIGYKIYKSKCFGKFMYDIDDNTYVHIRDLFNQYKPIIERKKREKIKNIDNQKELLKENKFLQTFSIIFVVLLSSIILYYLGLFFNWVYISVNWIKFFIFLGIILLGLSIIIGLSLLILKISEPISYWFKCRKCYLCKWKVWFYVNLFFTNIIRSITLIIDIVYNIYKKNCPLITWKE